MYHWLSSHGSNLKSNGCVCACKKRINIKFRHFRPTQEALEMNFLFIISRSARPFSSAIKILRCVPQCFRVRSEKREGIERPDEEDVSIRTPRGCDGRLAINSWHIIFICLYSTFMYPRRGRKSGECEFLGQTQWHNYVVWDSFAFWALSVGIRIDFTIMSFKKAYFSICASLPLSLSAPNPISRKKKPAFSGPLRGMGCSWLLFSAGTRSLVLYVFRST